MTPAGGPAHGPDIALAEPGDLALRGRDDDVVVAAGDVDPGELVAVVDRDGAMIPDERTCSNCSSGVFLMIPFRVASTR